LDGIVEAAGQAVRAESALRYLEQLEVELLKSGPLTTPAAQWFARTRDIARRSDPTPAWIGELKQKFAESPPGLTAVRG
jgi:hypothetical protein